MIKKILNTENYSNNINIILLLIRISIGLFMLTHGLGKFSKLFSGEIINFPDPLGVGVNASLALVVFSEVICSVFLIFGIATRISAVPLIITMLVAAFVIHANDGFGKKELPLLYTVFYFILVILGSGKISFDNWIFNKLYRR